MNMWTRLAAMLLLGLTGCSGSQPLPVDQFQLRISGPFTMDIDLERDGDGRFRITNIFSPNTRGTFSLTPEEFERFSQRVEPFREQALPFTEENMRQERLDKCPEGRPLVLHRGAIYIRWTNSNSDEYYIAYLGCDPERNAARNRELLSALKSLPVPWA